MRQFLVVFLGGGLGSTSRYFLGKYISDRFPSSLPLGTLTVNVCGCFVLGLILAIAEKQRWNPHWILLWGVGFCGGFTTFSTFAWENYRFLRNSNYENISLYILLSLGAGLLAVALGILGANLLKR
ncbi:MAG: fluoride efflux transporter CrcB [Chloroflexaceae bacterium]|nr:fluoride efflux transporter CrcB [Chloroflexaceae bacterium]